MSRDAQGIGFDKSDHDRERTQPPTGDAKFACEALRAAIANARRDYDAVLAMPYDGMKPHLLRMTEQALAAANDTAAKAGHAACVAAGRHIPGQGEPS
jgi:hypothetical protein